MSLDERIQIIENSIETVKSGSHLERDGIIEVLENSLKSEKADEYYISILVSSFTKVSRILLGILIMHFASLMFVFESLSKRKHNKANQSDA